MKAFETYLTNHGTEWQTVPCPMCRKRISYHVMLRSFVETCTLEDAQIVINDTNIRTRCHLDMSLLHVAAEAGNIQVVRYLIEKGLLIEDVNCFGLTPVYLAAVQGKTETIRYFVENCCANTRVKNILGQTMLDVVINQKKYPETIAYLQSIRVEQTSYCLSVEEAVPQILDKIITSTFSRLPPIVRYTLT